MKPDRGAAAYSTPTPVGRQKPDADDWLRTAKEARAIVAVLDEQLRADPPSDVIDTYTARRIERCARAYEDLHNKRKPELWT